MAPSAQTNSVSDAETVENENGEVGVFNWYCLTAVSLKQARTGR